MLSPPPIDHIEFWNSQKTMYLVSVQVHPVQAIAHLWLMVWYLFKMGRAFVGTASRLQATAPLHPTSRDLARQLPRSTELNR